MIVGVVALFSLSLSCDFEVMSVQVLVDGVPLTELDIRWFRKQLGVVSQVLCLYEPYVSQQNNECKLIYLNFGTSVHHFIRNRSYGSLKSIF